MTPSTTADAVPPLGLVVLVSGSGSNLQALIDASAHDGAAFRVLAVGADRDGTGRTPGSDRGQPDPAAGSQADPRTSRRGLAPRAQGMGHLALAIDLFLTGC